MIIKKIIKNEHYIINKLNDLDDYQVCYNMNIGRYNECNAHSIVELYHRITWSQESPTLMAF